MAKKKREGDPEDVDIIDATDATDVETEPEPASEPDAALPPEPLPDPPATPAVPTRRSSDVLVFSDGPYFNTPVNELPDHVIGMLLADALPVKWDSLTEGQKEAVRAEAARRSK